jgi:adhesin/invasin
LPTNLGGASVQFGSTTVPLLFSSTGQVNAIIPYGMAINTTQQVFVSLGASISVPEPITLAGAAPGIFTVDGQQGIVFDGANIANPANPAKAGDVLVIYCTGLGEVTPSVTAGTPAPISPLSNTVNTVTASIGGVAASVQFAGLTPGFAGLYQVNAVVPAGVAAGNQVPLILTAAGQSSTPVNITVH